MDVEKLQFGRELNVYRLDNNVTMNAKKTSNTRKIWLAKSNNLLACRCFWFSRETRKLRYKAGNGLCWGATRCSLSIFLTLY